MPTDTMRARPGEAVKQFSVFTPNRVGQLSDIIGIFGSHGVHILALTVLDTTDSAIMRLIVNDPDRARELLGEHDFSFTESEIVAVELRSTLALKGLIAALLEAELNIYYLYSFIPHPDGKAMLALSMEDNEMAEQTLRHHQFRVLNQSDISR